MFKLLYSGVEVQVLCTGMYWPTYVVCSLTLALSLWHPSCCTGQTACLHYCCLLSVKGPVSLQLISQNKFILDTFSVNTHVFSLFSTNVYVQYRSLQMWVCCWAQRWALNNINFLLTILLSENILVFNVYLEWMEWIFFFFAVFFIHSICLLFLFFSIFIFSLC